MNPFLLQIIVSMVESVGIPVLITALEMSLAANPSQAAAMKQDLLNGADAIYRTYGLTPPPHA